MSVPGCMQTGSDGVSIPGSGSDRTSAFEFSQSFSSYLFNKGMVPLGSVGGEDDEAEENYVPMSAAAAERPVGLRAPPPPPSTTSDPAVHPDENYVPMTPLSCSLPTEQASLGRQVPPPVHMGFRSSPRLNPISPPGEGGAESTPPPIHRDLKPQRRVKPAPLDITAVPQDWQEVPPPVRSPVTRTFTRDPSTHRSVWPISAHSSSPSSDSDDPDDSYIAMTTSHLSFSAGESSLRLMLHRASEGGVGSPLLWRGKRDKQVEYLDLDLHTGRSTPPRQKCSPAEGGNGGDEQVGQGDGRTRGERTRVDYVVVDPKRTKALRNTREAWHDGRMSTEKEKS